MWSIAERFQGCLIGLAIGDVLGMTARRPQ